MNLGLDQRVAMVAAASKGIGKACAVALAANGCKVSICGRDAATLEQARTELGGESIGVVADVASDADLARWHAETVSRLGDVDVLITNTGGPPVARFMELSDDQWRSGIESTLLNVVRLSRLVIPGMQRRRRGRIVHLTSFVAKQPVDEITISTTLRAGLSGLTKTMANQLGPDGITVNAVLMGHVMTARQEHLIEVRMKNLGLTRAQYLERAVAEIPLRRMGEPHEIGEVVAFLASERASYVTGVSLQVDGGLIKSTF